jgi:hypothetical protein
MFLESLGADAAVHRLFQPYAARGLLLARGRFATRSLPAVHGSGRTAGGSLGRVAVSNARPCRYARNRRLGGHASRKPVPGNRRGSAAAQDGVLADEAVDASRQIPESLRYLKSIRRWRVFTLQI